MEPPDIAAAVIAFSIDSRVMISRAVTPRLRTSIASLPHSKAHSALFASCAGTMAEANGEMPMTSNAIAIVLAVNWPPHAPAPGLAHRLDLGEVRVAHLAARVRADGLEDVHDRDVATAEAPGRDRAAVEHDAGQVEPRERHDRAGDRLVAAAEGDDAVEQVAAGDELDGVRDDLARHEAGASCPLVPIVIPSEIATVLSSIGVPPASRIPSFTRADSARRWKLHGIVSIQVEATPMIGLESASSS